MILQSSIALFFFFIKVNAYLDPDHLFTIYDEKNVQTSADKNFDSTAEAEGSKSESLQMELKECVCPTNSCADLVEVLAMQVFQVAKRASAQKGVDVTLLMTLTGLEVAAVNDFVTKRGTQEEAVRALTAALKTAQDDWTNLLPTKILHSTFVIFKEIIEKPQFIILCLVLALLLVMYWSLVHSRSPSLALTIVCIVVLIVSFGWNWLHLYQIALAELDQKLASVDYKLPNECRPSTKKAQQYIYSTLVNFWWPQYEEKKCRKYFEALHVQPHVSVNPGKVFAYTLSTMVLQPLDALAQLFLQWCDSLTGNELWLLSYPMKIILFLIFLSMFIKLLLDCVLQHMSRPRGAVLPNRNYSAPVRFDHKDPDGEEVGVITMNVTALKELTKDATKKDLFKRFNSSEGTDKRERQQELTEDATKKDLCKRFNDSDVTDKGRRERQLDCIEDAIKKNLFKRFNSSPAFPKRVLSKRRISF